MVRVGKYLHMGSPVVTNLSKIFFPIAGEMMMSLFWFYRPEHTEHDSIHSESPYELYASKHKDINSVACIEDKCYVLTFNEYCR